MFSVGSTLDDAARRRPEVDASAQALPLRSTPAVGYKQRPAALACPLGTLPWQRPRRQHARPANPQHRAAYPAGLNTRPYAASYGWAELFETAEVLYAIDRAEPIAGSSLTCASADLLANGADSACSAAPRPTSTSAASAPESPTSTSTRLARRASVASGPLSFSGIPVASGCSVACGLCSGFISVYAALDAQSAASATDKSSPTAGGTLDLDLPPSSACASALASRSCA